MREKDYYRELVRKHASKFGLQQEALEVFDHEVKQGEDPSVAAFEALHTWDCLATEED